MSKKLLIILSVCFLLLLAGVLVFKDKLNGRNATIVVLEEANLRSLTESVTANGKIYPFKEVKLSLELPGEVTDIFVNEGDSVVKGDLLLEIEADNYVSSVSQSNAAYNQAQANLSSAKARKSQADAQFQIIETDYNRKTQLYQKQIISAIEFEASESQYFNALGEKEAAFQAVESSGYQVQSASAGLQQTRDNLSRTKLYAPMSGIVSKLNVEQGEKVVGTAQMAGTELITISDFEEMELKIEVGENEVLQINKGDTALIEVDAYLGEEILGIVSQVAYSSNALLDQQVTKFEVKIKLVKTSYAKLTSDESILPFRPGMSATAEIITNKKEDILCTPIQSVTLRDPNEEDNFDEKIQVVFVFQEGKVIQREVKTGIQDDTYIEILSGVNPGEKVVSAPFKAISKELENDLEVKEVSEEELYEEK
ncbi:MAG: HlyD family secretion protein [Chitinophagales bacterium]|jgi:HlyD family secretion protein